MKLLVPLHVDGIRLVQPPFEVNRPKLSLEALVSFDREEKACGALARGAIEVRFLEGQVGGDPMRVLVQRRKLG